MTKIAEALKTHQAHQAMLLDDARQSLALARHVARAHQEQMLGRPLGETFQQSSIHIGDVNTSSRGETKGKPVVSRLAKTALAVALASGLVGAGTAVPLAVRALTAPAAVDTDTQFQLRLVK